MCTLALLSRPGHDWPLILATNRDEMADRAWRPPAAWWEDRPGVVAGLDEAAGGSWLGLNAEGVVAAILNRDGTLGRLAGKRSRGELVLEALDHADALDAAKALSALDPFAYRPFNLVVADNRDAFWLANDGRRINVHPIGPGAHMLTSRGLDDPASPRIARYLPRLRALPPPAPDPGPSDGGDWSAWAALMGDRGQGDGDEAASMCFLRPDGFGTVSCSLIALPAVGAEVGPDWRFAAGPPDRVPFARVAVP